MTANRPERDLEYFMNPDYKYYAEMQKNPRKERRDAIIMIILGVVFAALGVFLWFVGIGWMALTGITFGAAIVVGGILVWSQADGSLGSPIVGIVACLLFATFSLFMILTAIVSPESWGFRGPIWGVIGGGIGLAFFGPGSILLIIKETRRRRARSNTPQYPNNHPYA